MMFTTLLEPVANRLLLLTNILSYVKIDQLQVPQVIASDCLDAILDCVYSGATDNVTVIWLRNGMQLFEWRQGTEPKASGVLDGRLDLAYAIKVGDRVENRALRFVELTPELSGDYTCIVRSRGQEAKETKSMTVYSPESEFELTFSAVREPGVVDIKCVAKQLHPRPNLMLEYDNVPIEQQQQRVWREGQYFDGECSASLPWRELRPGTELACRLQLPQVEYTAITKKFFHIDNHASRAVVIGLTSSCIIGSVIISSCT